MSGNGLLNDPAIIGLSSPTETKVSDGAVLKRPGLEPGSALSKLLDSAMANAAREATPDPDLRHDGSLGLDSKRSSFQSFIPYEKGDVSKIYSITSLLKLRSSPAILEFDASRLPEASFWRTRKGMNAKHNTSSNCSNALGGTGKRSRRNNQLAVTNSNGNALHTLNWDRKPVGFLKHSEVDYLSTDTISQLLREAPEEETPEWDVPGSNTDLKIEMGHTVEDFERWKLHMREEERRKHGEAEPLYEDEESAPANEVDNFFSLVKLNEVAPDNSAFSFNKQAENKSSRFSSFFGGSAPGPENSRSSSIDSDPSRSARGSSKSENSVGSLRFFHVDSNVKHSPRTQSPERKPKPQDRVTHGPPPGMLSHLQNFNSGRPQQAMPGPHGLPPHSNPPPGFPMLSGSTIGSGGRSQPTNDSFFLSLLNKSEVGLGPESGDSMGIMRRQGASLGESHSSEGAICFGGGGSQEPNLSALTTPSAPQTNPLPYHQYQDAPLGMVQQRIGMKAPPGMKLMPPGMFPPGTFSSGTQGISHHGSNSNHPGQHHLVGPQGPQQANGQGPANMQMRGDVPPPWMRFGPNIPAGVVPPGLSHLPRGFRPGFPQAPPNNQQQQQQCLRKV